MSILPQRPPILLLDEVTHLTKDTVEAGYTVPPDLPVLAGHFPGTPVFPGVYAVESMAQTADILLLYPQANRGKQPLFVGMDHVRFRRRIEPGNHLRLTAERTRHAEPAGIDTFRTCCYDRESGALCASAVLLLSPR